MNSESTQTNHAEKVDQVEINLLNRCVKGLLNLPIILSGVAVIAMSVAGCPSSNRPTSDCATVRSMIDYNNEFNEDVRE